MRAKQLDHDATTRLVTDLTFLGVGPDTKEALQERLDRMTGMDNRILVGDIQTDAEGRAVCGVSFNCDSYDPPTEGPNGETIADPRAIADLKAILGEVNYDSCLYWDPIEALTDKEVVSA